MNLENLLELIQNGENATVELKVAPPRLAEIAQRLCGMANAAGGYLILGVEDKTLVIRGLKTPQDAVDELFRAARMCKPPLSFDPPDPEIFLVKDKKVVVATIPANHALLYQASGVFWVRRGTHTVPLDVQEIGSYLYSRGISSWERKPVLDASIDDLDLVQVQEFIETRPERLRKSGRLDNLEEVLLNLHCVSKVAYGDSYKTHPTNAGLMLFGKFPQRNIIQAEVTCILYSDNLGAQRFKDRRVVSGAVRELIDGAEDFFRKYIAVAGRIEGFRRIDEPEYPLEVLREALVNAVVHRDYSLEGESVRVFFYPDRIEIRNPGLLLPGLTVEELEGGRAVSKLRNPIIAGVLRDLPGSYMERAGTGVKYIIDQLARSGFPKPKFHQVGEFILTIYQKPPVRLGNQEQPSGFSVNVDLDSVIETRLQKLMSYLHQKGKITNREYRALTGVSEATGQRDFEQLVTRGVLKIVGKGRARYYTLP